jgi:hypothetical protein
MTITVVTSPFSTSCNSYVSIADMLTYVTDRVPDPAVLTAWEALSDELQALYLVNATRSLDFMFEWIGDRYSRDQKLDWPRTSAFVDGFLLDQITFPQPIIEATCEMAIWSMQNAGLIAVQQNASYDSIKVGPINIDFNEQVGGASQKYAPDIVAYLLTDYGTLSDPNVPSANRMRVVRTNRA